MKLRHLTLLLCVSLSLTGCSALLERNYATVEPHSSKFWESEAAGTLRAENYQDIVNDLLILIGQHTESATVRLYNYEDDLTVADTLEQATTEVQQETPMGAYAVEYITASSRSQRGYYEISIQVSYRRTAEQIQAVVNATSTEALSALLEAGAGRGPHGAGGPGRLLGRGRPGPGGGDGGTAPGGARSGRDAALDDLLLSGTGSGGADRVCDGRRRRGCCGRKFGKSCRRVLTSGCFSGRIPLVPRA